MTPMAYSDVMYEGRASTASTLIDPTEMYLLTVAELEEEDVRPLRARLVERLGVSAPACSETVDRLAGRGLLVVEEDRTLTLTPKGRLIATGVIRKHRLAERLLVDVIGLEWEYAHAEACRWEHIISAEVADKIAELLGNPSTSPYGNLIPGLADDIDDADWMAASDALPPATVDPVTVVVRAISEDLQTDAEALRDVRALHLLPGERIRLRREPDGRLLVLGDDREELLPTAFAVGLFVTLA